MDCFHRAIWRASQLLEWSALLLASFVHPMCRRPLLHIPIAATSVLVLYLWCAPPAISNGSTHGLKTFPVNGSTETLRQDLDALSRGYTHVVHLNSWAFPSKCNDTVAALTSYGAWHSAQLERLRTTNGDLTRLSNNADDTPKPLSAAVHGGSGGGWGDRIVSIVSLFGFALRYKRLFFLNYPALAPWMHSPFFDWSINGTLPLLQRAVRLTELQILYAGNGALTVWDHPAPAERWPASSPVVHVIGNRGIWSAASRQENIDFFDHLTRGVPACLQQALFRPTPALQQFVQPYTSRFAAVRARGHLVVGVHFRSGDASLAAGGRPQLWFDTMTTQFQQVLVACTRAPNRTVFFASDSATLKRDVARLFGAAIITTDIEPRHVGEPGDYTASEADVVRDTMAEWWLLAQCDFLAFDVSSGFARSAVAASASGQFMGVGPGDCDAASTGHEALRQMYHHGSGF